jgi:hypothetical protein
VSASTQRPWLKRPPCHSGYFVALTASGDLGRPPIDPITVRPLSRIAREAAMARARSLAIKREKLSP